MSGSNRGVWIGLLWILIGSACFGIGILASAHVLTGIGMIALPAGILYSLLAGYPSHRAPGA